MSWQTWSSGEFQPKTCLRQFLTIFLQRNHNMPHRYLYEEAKQDALPLSPHIPPNVQPMLDTHQVDSIRPARFNCTHQYAYLRFVAVTYLWMSQW